MNRYTQPQLDASMGPAFGGIILRPMDTGKGGWTETNVWFPSPVTHPDDEPWTLDQLLELAAEEEEYGLDSKGRE